MRADCLVGMTEGAKKRNARMFVAYAHPAGNPMARRLAQETWQELLHIGEDPYGKARALYRVGERLRPCPACAAHRRMRLWGMSVPYPCPARPPGAGRVYERCDGTGLLPARKARRDDDRKVGQ